MTDAQGESADGQAPQTDIAKMETVAPEEGAKCDGPDMDPETPGHQCEPPNRTRRTWFIFVSVAIAYLSVMGLAFFGSGKIAELVADGLVSYIMVIAVSYVAAHTIDRSEIFEKMGQAFGRRYNSGA